MTDYETKRLREEIIEKRALQMASDKLKSEGLHDPMAMYFKTHIERYDASGEYYAKLTSYKLHFMKELKEFE